MSDKEYRCDGCGIVIQTEDPSQLGYVPPKVLEEREEVYCRRCFRIRHYNEIAPVEQDPDIYLHKLAEIAETDSLVVQVVDLFDFSGSWIPGIHRHIGKNPLLLLANKIDLFPKSTKWGKLKDWLRKYVKELGIYPVDIILCSAEKGIHMDEALEAIEKYRDRRDVYVVGTTNAGKSTFINRILKEVAELDEIITTSPYPGTTLDAIRIPLDDGKAIIDTPGIVRKDRLSEWVRPTDLHVVIPKQPLNPRIYQLNDQQTLFFGGLARMDYIEGERQSFVCYVSNHLYVHRTKLQNADAFLEKHHGKMLSPPQDPAQLPPWKKHRFFLPGHEKQDIVISGLGWIACGKEKGLVEVWAPKGVQVVVRPAII
ncbi:ribosome biogenesis GTPase YqeH [Thermoflavimicrobium dichotomicum]|uniref:CP-type G domain-containing protein n=1 Tax=Thermoflavimicrobium dichotomicum TaxID=46223 RepID=A0A1I3NMF1_9BACL|nr:ribosome biogenesis GTPase YqeH [Thermoflavimicrobium dichotomicum]SFJ10369.1 hypothetical protein SAMN05421852_104201 [Thermoflavimicrobium dichotomicum]